MTSVRLCKLTLGGVTIDQYMGSKITHKTEMKNVIFQKNYLSKLLEIIITTLRLLIKVIFDNFAIR